MESQSQINRIPLATCADFAYNSQAYDPARSIGQAILLLGKTEAQQRILKQLVETYPGFLVTGGGTGTNPVREKFKKLARESDAQTTKQFVHQMEELSAGLTENFPSEFNGAKRTLVDDLEWMNQKLAH